MFGISPIGLKVSSPSFVGSSIKVEEDTPAQKKEETYFPEGTKLARVLIANRIIFISSFDKDGKMLKKTEKPQYEDPNLFKKLENAKKENIEIVSPGGYIGSSFTSLALKMAELDFGQDSKEYKDAKAAHNEMLERRGAQSNAQKEQAIQTRRPIIPKVPSQTEVSYVSAAEIPQRFINIAERQNARFGVANELDIKHLGYGISGSSARAYALDGNTLRQIEPELLQIKPLEMIQTRPNFTVHHGMLEDVPREKEDLMFAAVTKNVSNGKTKYVMNLKLSGSQAECAKGVARSIENSIKKNNGTLVEDTIKSVNSRMLRHRKKDPLPFGDTFNIITASGYQVEFSTSAPAGHKFGKKGKPPQNVLNIYDPNNECIYTKKTYEETNQKMSIKGLFERIGDYFAFPPSTPSMV